MMKLIPTRQCNKEIERRLPATNELLELSDWTLRDIGIVRQTPAFDAVKPFWMA